MVLTTSLPSPIPSTPTKHSSSSCGSKKTRKGSFGQSTKTTSATEVGDFQGGYFIMPSPSPSSPSSKYTTQSNKSSYSSSYDKKNKRFETPQRDVGVSPPKNTYDHTSSSSAKSEATPTKKNSSRKVNASPKTCSASPSTSPSSSYIQQAVGHTPNTTTPINNITHSSISSKLNDASSSSSRWAGPAFSNAPPPSSLPLPSFPPLAPSPSTAQSAIPPSVTQYPQHHYHIQSIPPPPVSYSLDHQDPSSLSAYPFANMLPSLDSAHHQPPSYVRHPHDESSWLSSLNMHHHHLPSHSVMMSSNHHHQHDEKVPPASSSYPYAPLPSASPVVSLADLSTDLRRMLNISSTSTTPSSATMMSDHSLLGSRLIPVHSS